MKHYYSFSKRLFDIFLSFLLLLLFIIPMIIIFILIFIIDKQSPIFWSKRVGLYSVLFNMPKFRTMKSSSPIVATHLFKQNDHITFFGKILRRMSFDEIPQLYNIFKGDMSFVGPRPALFNQYDLIELRKKHKIDNILPGITGLAQINGRDKLTIKEKVQYEEEYLYKRSFIFDLSIIFKTIFMTIMQKNITH